MKAFRGNFYSLQSPWLRSLIVRNASIHIQYYVNQVLRERTETLSHTHTLIRRNSVAHTFVSFYLIVSVTNCVVINGNNLPLMVYATHSLINRAPFSFSLIRISFSSSSHFQMCITAIRLQRLIQDFQCVCARMKHKIPHNFHCN